jgi:class 3 adenylate cyclase
MPNDPLSRRLTTIVALDVAGYSARTEADEARTTAEVAALRSVIERIATAHGGRVFNTAGDGFMLEFGSSLAAVEAAVALASTCEPRVRVGVHLGDVVVQPNGDLLGHGVNVTARLMARVPDMSFPVANLLRALAFLEDWEAIDRLLDPAARHPLREFQNGLAFIRTKRDPTPENIGAIRDALAAHCTTTGGIDVSRLVYAAHLGLVEEAYQAAGTACLGPRGTDDDIMGPDGYRTGLLFHAGMPELRNDPRFVPLCARLGLVEFWLATGTWPDCADNVPYDFKAECEKARVVSIDEFRF